MPLGVTRQIECKFLAQLSKIREMQKETSIFHSSLSKAGLTAIHDHILQTRTWRKDSWIFGVNLHNTELSDMNSGVFASCMYTQGMADQRHALFSDNGTVRSPTKLLDDWFASSIYEERWIAGGMLDSLKTNRRMSNMFKKGNTVLETVEEAFPTLSEFSHLSEVSDMVNQDTTATCSPDTPDTPCTPDLGKSQEEVVPHQTWGSYNDNVYLPEWEDIKKEEHLRCIETLTVKDRKTWDTEEALRKKKMDFMKGELQGSEHCLENFQLFQDKKRTRQMADLAGPVYRTLKKKY
jgi:hypothetical protein